MEISIACEAVGHTYDNHNEMALRIKKIRILRPSIVRFCKVLIVPFSMFAYTMKPVSLQHIVFSFPSPRRVRFIILV